jgi:hypothetical protein
MLWYTSSKSFDLGWRSRRQASSQHRKMTVVFEGVM